MPDDAQSLYDQLAANYHLIFQDWYASIGRQAAILSPILERECGKPDGVRILDCACGIGTQLLGLASRGFRVTGCDLSQASVERTRKEAEQRGLDVRVFAADMLDLSVVPEGNFDAVICMDNALPHLRSDEQLLQALRQIRKKLRVGRLFMASIRDYDDLVRNKPLMQEPAFFHDHGKRRIVHQVWDWTSERSYTFHLYITRETENGWDSQHYASNYRALLREELNRLLEHARFTNCRWLRPAESGFYQPIVLATAK
jgi:2-polyprenyl-3-methyl-5-hydroxy-6-metoxy-1,4-benzoquinol methylase